MNSEREKADILFDYGLPLQFCCHLIQFYTLLFLRVATIQNLFSIVKNWNVRWGISFLCVESKLPMSEQPVANDLSPFQGTDKISQILDGSFSKTVHGH